MSYQFLIPGPIIMVPILMMTTKGIHTTKNNNNLPSDVIITYSNHAEASHENKVVSIGTTMSTETTVASTSTTSKTIIVQPDEHKSVEVVEMPRLNKLPPKRIDEDETEDVVFIPNERTDYRERQRNEYYFKNEGHKLGDIMGGQKSMDDYLSEANVRLETEAPVSDIMFVVGKNNDNVHQEEKDKESRRWQGEEYKPHTTVAPKLNCSDLNCKNTVKSICGTRIENYQKKYRLFLNDCYYRKVNCNFKIPTNRYRKVALENCKNAAAHTQSPFSFSARPYREKAEPQPNNTRKSASSRRSMTMDMYGRFCSHPCPTSCPDHYEPECAVSNTGRHRVFVNHCALDKNSCSFAVVWHRVPLSQCVGGKKADMQQNAGFIGWMQRIGIVDKKGRLVYDER